MKILNKYLFIICIFVFIHPAWGYQSEMSRPPLEKIKSAVSLVPGEYQKEVLSALRKSGRNGWELIYAIEKTKPQLREGIAFLIANMPGRDLVGLKGNFLIINDRLASMSTGTVGGQISTNALLK